VEFPELKRLLVDQAKEWNANAVLVEDAASGQSVIQELRTTAVPVLPIKADSDKLSRTAALTPLLEAGKVLLPESAPWLTDYLDERAAFPTGAHDDAVDSTTQALNDLRSNWAGTGIQFVGRPRRWPEPEPFRHENLFTKIL